MYRILALLIFSSSLLAQAESVVSPASPDGQAACPAMFNVSMRLLHSQKSVNVCDIVRGHPVLVVNTASHCGFTPQFKGLEALHEKYKDKGLVVLGFASDDFWQEDKSEAEAAKICYVNFGVTFTVFAPTAVRGDDVNHVFAELNKQAGKPSWNFNKYLVDANGKVIEHFGSRVKPDSPKLTSAIDALLEQK